MAPKYFIKRKTLIRRREKTIIKIKVLKEEIELLKSEVMDTVEDFQRMLQAMVVDVEDIDKIIANKDKKHVRL